MMKSVGIVGGCIVLAALILWGLAPERSSSDLSGAVVINGHTIRVMIAATPAERTQGLSGTPSLKSGEGMLFVFPEEGVYSFWMKDMLFSIDILWISARGEVVHIEEGVSPNTYPTSFTSDIPAQYVLEVPAGFSHTYGIKIGDHATLPENFPQ